MRQLLFWCTLALACLPAPADAANCKKGCACGSVCIPCSRACHVGSSPSWTPPTRATSEPTRGSPKAMFKASRAMNKTSSPARSKPSRDDRIVRLRDPQTYYPKTCAALAADLAQFGSDFREQEVSERQAKTMGCRIAPACRKAR